MVNNDIDIMRNSYFRLRNISERHENAGKCPDIFIIRCARAGHGS